MLVLPTGQILLTDFSNDIELYTSASGPRREWAPVVAYVPNSLRVGRSYQAFGFRFNGLSQGAFYGDDAQAATNFPLVRITNLATGHVRYSRAHDPIASQPVFVTVGGKRAEANWKLWRTKGQRIALQWMPTCHGRGRVGTPEG